MSKHDLTTVAQFIGYASVLAIPVGLLIVAFLRSWAARLNRADESDVTGINAIPAEWPSDSLSREFEQEPRGM